MTSLTDRQTHNGSAHSRVFATFRRLFWMNYTINGLKNCCDPICVYSIPVTRIRTASSLGVSLQHSVSCFHQLTCIEHWLSCFYQITCIDDCPASIKSHVLMTVLLLSTHMYWWLSCFSQLTCIDDCPASLNSHVLMTVLLLSTHKNWCLSCIYQLTCIDDYPTSINSHALMTVLVGSWGRRN